MLNSPVQKIKERLKIEEVVSSYIKLEKAGNNLKARCPFHNEKSPSFFVSPERDSYYCFGCGAKGDIFNFVEEFEGLDFKGTLKLLAERAGVSLSDYKDKIEEGSKDRLYKVMSSAQEFFVLNLKNNKSATDYLQSRGLEEKSIVDFAVGFAKDEWGALHTHLLKLGFKDKEMEDAGLIKKANNGKFYDRFRGRIMFPINDSSGRVVAFSGRTFVDENVNSAALSDPSKSAKYLNSPETSIFNKSSILYGIDKAKDAIRKNDFSILVEGQMDLILSHQAGFKNTLATSGTALSDSMTSKEHAISNLGLVRRLSNKIVLAFDADKAGISASGRAAKIALSFGMDVKVANLPEGVDPADVISKEGPDKWKEAIRNSKHIIEFLTTKILDLSRGDHRKALREIKAKVLPYIMMIDSSIEKAFFLKQISDLTNVPLSALEEDLKKVEVDSKEERKEEGAKEKSRILLERRDHILHRLLGILFWQDSIKERKIDTVGLLNELQRILNIDKQKIMDNVSEDKSDLIFEAEVFYNGEKDLIKDVDELLSNLEEESIREELSEKMFELKKSEMDKDGPMVAKILHEIQSIHKKMEVLKNNRLSK